MHSGSLIYRVHLPDFAYKLIPLLFLGLFIVSCGKNVHEKGHRSQTSKVDTIAIKKYYDKAESLKSSNPDSAIFLLKQGLRKLSSEKIDTTSEIWKARILVKLGNMTLSKGELDESRASDSIALLIGQTYSDKRIIAQAINNMGLLAYSHGDFETAQRDYESALAIAKSNGYQDIMAKVYTNKAVISFLQGNQTQAQTLFIQTLSIGKKLKDTALIAGTFINLGMCYFGSDCLLSNTYYFKAVHIYQHQGNLSDQVICYQNIGANYLSLDEYQEAIDAFLKSLDYATKTGDKSNIAKDYHNLGELYGTIGDFPKAVDYYIRAAKIKESINDKVSSADTYNGLGSVYLRNDQYSKAEAAYRKALKIFQDLKMPQGEAAGYGNLADIFLQKGNAVDAAVFYQKALRINEAHQYFGAIAENFSSLGSAYRQTGYNFKAEGFYKKAIDLYKKVQNRSNQALTMVEYARLELNNYQTKRKNRYSLLHAIRLGEEAFSMGKAIGSIQVIHSASSLLKEAYHYAGNEAKAFRYAEAYIEANDSLYRKDKAEAQLFADARWNDEKRMRTIQQLEDQKLADRQTIARIHTESELQRSVIISIIAILVLTVSGFTFMVLYLKKRKDSQLHRQQTILTSLRMQNARNRLSPHFLFNVLGTIAGKANQPEVLRNHVQALSLLLRQNLENVEKQLVGIDDEIRFVEAFVELQRDRIPGAFEFRLDVEPGIDTKKEIPAMLIQIPVENAIRHGLIPMPEDQPKVVSVSIHCDLDGMYIHITDNGVGLYASGNQHKGTGTGLKVLYQTIYWFNEANRQQMTLDLEQRKDQPGTLVRIFIPAGFVYIHN